MQANTYIDRVVETIRRAYDSQTEVIGEAAARLAATLEAKHAVYVFGCSHAGILAEEVFYRTGGLAVLNPIFFPGFMLNTRPITMTSQLERLPGLGKILVEQNGLQAGDLLLIHSVSGRNTVPVEMALEAKARGVTTIALTSVAYSQSVTSRHESGKRLYEVCDLVIDNGGVPGDAAVTLPGLPEAIGPTSTSAGAALLNALVIEAVACLLANGTTPPVFLSANLDGGDAHNRAIFEQYKDQIHYQ